MPWLLLLLTAFSIEPGSAVDWPLKHRNCRPQPQRCKVSLGSSWRLFVRALNEYLPLIPNVGGDVCLCWDCALLTKHPSFSSPFLRSSYVCKLVITGRKWPPPVIRQLPLMTTTHLKRQASFTCITARRNRQTGRQAGKRAVSPPQLKLLLSFSVDCVCFYPRCISNYQYSCAHRVSICFIKRSNDGRALLHYLKMKKNYEETVHFWRW